MDVLNWLSNGILHVILLFDGTFFQLTQNVLTGALLVSSLVYIAIRIIKKAKKLHK